MVRHFQIRQTCLRSRLRLAVKRMICLHAKPVERNPIKCQRKIRKLLFERRPLPTAYCLLPTINSLQKKSHTCIVWLLRHRINRVDYKSVLWNKLLWSRLKQLHAFLSRKQMQAVVIPDGVIKPTCFLNSLGIELHEVDPSSGRSITHGRLLEFFQCESC